MPVSNHEVSHKSDGIDAAVVEVGSRQLGWYSELIPCPDLVHVLCPA